ncbi:hypothetical protein THRCLA_03364 [Thraustotheca clavata]|uniref:Pentacotripeptide-repeat region of PRORP domain-containing protein n=1 Tax=Thraustotheca clavata TaxID=74557 RepID=A0A1W0A2X0_9STRA|nr:hypothetical protein THRCLA_03364 [Thraustotheca clavata]
MFQRIITKCQHRPLTSLARVQENQWKNALQKLSRDEWHSVLTDGRALGLATHLHKDENYAQVVAKYPELLEPTLNTLVQGIHAQFPDSLPAQQERLSSILSTMAEITSNHKMSKAAAYVITSCAAENPTQAMILYKSLYATAKDKAAPAGTFHYLFTSLAKHQHVDEAFQLLEFAKVNKIKPRSDHLGFALYHLNQHLHASELVPSFLKLTIDLLSSLKFDANLRFWRQSFTVATTTKDPELVLELYKTMRAKKMKPDANIIAMLLHYFHPSQVYMDSCESLQLIYRDLIASNLDSQEVYELALNCATYLRNNNFVQEILNDIKQSQYSMTAPMYNAALNTLTRSSDDADHNLALDLYAQMNQAQVSPTKGTLTALVRLFSSSREKLVQVLDELSPLFVNVMVTSPVTDSKTHCAYVAIYNLIRHEKDTVTAQKVVKTLKGLPFETPMIERIIFGAQQSNEYKLASDWILHFGPNHDLSDNIYERWFTGAAKAQASLAKAAVIFEQWHRYGRVSLEQFEQVIYALCQRQEVLQAFEIYDFLEIPPNEKICITLMKALYEDSQNKQRVVDESYKDFFYIAVERKEANLSMFRSAMNVAMASNDVEFMREIIESTVLNDAVELDLLAYNKALCGCAQHQELHELGLQVFDHMHTHDVKVNELTMMACMKMAKSFPASSPTFDLLENFRQLDQWPTIKVYTAFLEILAQNEKWADCELLLQVLVAQNVELDLKAATLFGCVFAQQCKQDELIKLVKTMRDKGIKPDALFLRDILARLGTHLDVDMCLDFCKQVLSVARCQEYYFSMIELALQHGLLDRALNLVIQMECDGFTVNSAIVLDIVEKTTSNREMDKLISVFAQLNDGEVSREEPFDEIVFDTLLQKATDMKVKPGMSLRFIQRQAKAHGYNIVHE